MPDETPVDELYQDFQELIGTVGISDLSLQTTLRITFSKSLLMAVAGYFEDQVQSQVIGFVRASTSSNELVEELVLRRSFGRHYSALFTWDANNANTFFRHFGNAFHQAMSQYANEHSEYQEAVRAFLDIGNTRNKLAHGNYAQFPMYKTIEEIYASYKVALQFVDSIGNHLARVSADLARRSAPDSS